MTRKDFELIASTLHGYGAADPGLIDALARTFADKLKVTNKQFNRDKFLRACGVTP